jgi:hypothetical protein
MLIELTCSCGKRLQVSAESAGAQGQCPACGERLQIPKRDINVNGGPAIEDKENLTGVGCVLTLLSVVVIFAVALPIVRWRDPLTGNPFPKEVAIATPVLIGAAVYGIGSLFLKLIGVRVWSKRESDTER